jgi:hypothetical protein
MPARCTPGTRKRPVFPPSRRHNPQRNMSLGLVGYNEGNAPGTFSDRRQALKGRHNRAPSMARRAVVSPFQDLALGRRPRPQGVALALGHKWSVCMISIATTPCHCHPCDRSERPFTRHKSNHGNWLRLVGYSKGVALGWFVAAPSGLKRPGPRTFRASAGKSCRARRKQLALFHLYRDHSIKSLKLKDLRLHQADYRHKLLA